MARGTECEFPDMTGLDPIDLEPNASPAAGTGGDIAGGRWELVEVRYTTEPAFGLTGNARSVLELDAQSTTSGQASLSLEVTITSPEEEEIDEVGAGPYSATGNMLSFQNDCGDELTLDEVEYSIDLGGENPLMTLWGSSQFVISDPISLTITIFLEAQYELVEPQTADDPIFEDRFQASENAAQ